MNQTPEKPECALPNSPRECRPLWLDFEKLAALLSDGADQRGVPPRLRTVEHAVTHLREETELTDREIARVLLTMSILLGELVRDLGPKWDATATANWLGLCGRQLWEADERPTGRRLRRLMAPLGVGLGHRTNHGQDDEPDTQDQREDGPDA